MSLSCPIIKNKLKRIPITILTLTIFGIISKPLYKLVFNNENLVQKSLKEAIDFVARDLIILFTN